jgi:GTPase
MTDTDHLQDDATEAAADGAGDAPPSGPFQPGPNVPTRAGFVAIVGKPNVGKSTLLNTLLGVKVAPITSKPQTTRRGVRGIYSVDHRQLVFVDTPGYHRGSSALSSAMNQAVRDSIIDVEVVLWVVDLRRPPNEEDKDVARLLGRLADETRVWLIGNKVDAAKYPDEALALYGELAPRVERVVTLSALNDPGAVYALRDDLLELLPSNPFFFPGDIRSDQSRETWASELVRESAMTHLRQELPYAVAVKVQEWDDPNEAGDEPIYILAEIWVEKPGHRPIVLGKGGKMIKEIGRTARKQLEVFLHHRVYLDLEVLVRRDWRDDREALRELGYEV